MATFDIKKLLQSVVSHKASDLHLVSGTEPQIRLDGVLKPVNLPPMTGEDIEEMCYSLITERQKQYFEEHMELDFALFIPSIGRFRGNFYRTLGDTAAAFRTIPIDVPSLDDLGAPEVYKQLIKREKGLILVTGPTGSGKSTTLAAILDKINRETNKHIITVEDPIEFIHKDRGCLINQRAIGMDTHSFSDALRAALREDPDIILVGEMRDLETIDIALHAANTGHLVFSTLHTLDAKETIDRIVGMFSTEEQNRIRGSLASVLEGVISQRLIPTKDGGRAAAIEVLKKTSRIEQLIMENRDYEIPDALFEGKEIYGTQTFDQALLDLIRADRITEEIALEYATNAADMKLKMQGVGKGAIVSDANSAEAEDVFAFKEDDEEQLMEGLLLHKDMNNTYVWEGFLFKIDRNINKVKYRNRTDLNGSNE